MLVAASNVLPLLDPSRSRRHLSMAQCGSGRKSLWGLRWRVSKGTTQPKPCGFSPEKSKITYLLNAVGRLHPSRRLASLQTSSPSTFSAHLRSGTHVFLPTPLTPAPPRKAVTRDCLCLRPELSSRNWLCNLNFNPLPSVPGSMHTGHPQGCLVSPDHQGLRQRRTNQDLQ